MEPPRPLRTRRDCLGAPRCVSLAASRPRMTLGNAGPVLIVSINHVEPAHGRRVHPYASCSIMHLRRCALAHAAPPILRWRRAFALLSYYVHAGFSHVSSARARASPTRIFLRERRGLQSSARTRARARKSGIETLNNPPRGRSH